jgi:hypothetical protein
MNDPAASLRERAGVLTTALEQWAGQATTPDQAAARRAARTAVDAIDALLRELFLLRGHLVQEIRHSGTVVPAAQQAEPERSQVAAQAPAASVQGGHAVHRGRR